MLCGAAGQCWSVCGYLLGEEVMILNGCLEQAGGTKSESLDQTKVKVDRENEKHVGDEGLQKRVCWKRTWM